MLKRCENCGKQFTTESNKPGAADALMMRYQAHTCKCNLCGRTEWDCNEAGDCTGAEERG